MTRSPGWGGRSAHAGAPVPDHMPWLGAQRREARAETMTAVADRILASRGDARTRASSRCRRAGRRGERRNRRCPASVQGRTRPPRPAPGPAPPARVSSRPSRVSRRKGKAPNSGSGERRGHDTPTDSRRPGCRPGRRIFRRQISRRQALRCISPCRPRRKASSSPRLRLEPMGSVRPPCAPVGPVETRSSPSRAWR